MKTDRAGERTEQDTAAPRAVSGGSWRKQLAHGVSLLLALALLPLVTVGAGVTSKDAGMAFPDWPTSNGVLLNPPGWFQQEDTRWEHGHRLVGWGVGVLAIVAAVFTWSHGGAVRALGWGTLGAIVVQGVLGGLRVSEVSTGLAMLHGIWGQVCLCLAALTALLTSGAWGRLGPVSRLRAGRLLRRLCLAVTAAVMIQLLLGASVRHFGSDHALVAHVIWAVVVLFLAGWLVMWIVGAGSGPSLPIHLAKVLGILMCAQLVLGGVAWLVTMAPGARSGGMVWIVPTAHVVVGSLILASSVLLTTCIYRLVKPTGPAVAKPAWALAS